MSNSFSRLCLASSIAILTACGGGGGGDGGGSGSGSSNSVALGGSAVKGPLANAVAEVYALDTSADNLQGELVDSGSTNSQAEFTGINLVPANAPYLLVVTADEDTVDITTDAAPIISTLRTVITAESLTNNAPIYATPLTSMAVQVVASREDTDADNLQSQLTNAQNQVKTTLGFGLDQSVDIFTTAPLLTDETDTPEEQQAVAEYRLAIEALSAVVDGIASETDDSDDTAEDVLNALAEDLADGEIDGMAGSEMLQELNGYDVADLDDVVVADLTIPGTTTPVNDIEDVLTEDTEDTGASQSLDESIDVTGDAPVLVADTDLDSIGDNLDNCPLTPNTNQSDTNSNDVGDVCDSAPVIDAGLTASVLEDGSVEVDLSQGVSDAEGDSLTYRVAGVVLDGSVYTFSPNANENGERVIDYEVSDGTSETTGSLTVTITAQNDPGSVEISGTAEQGQTLTAQVIDDIDGLSNASITYEWRSGSALIPNANSNTLLLTQDQVGQTIRVSATYTDDEGFPETVESDATFEVADVNDAPTGDIELVGVAREDETVSVSTDALNDLDGNIRVLAYQWRADGENIPDADGPEFVIPESLVGSTLSVEVTFDDGVFTSDIVTRTAGFGAPVANANDVATGNVLISDTSPSEDQVLQATLDNVQDSDGLENASYSYQWLADGEIISGATTTSFTPSQTQVGTALSVRVSFTDDFGSAESLTSSQTALVANVNDAPQGSVTISGSPVVGQTLTASNNLSDEDGLGDISYEWLVNGARTQVNGATYVVQESDVDNEISVVASYEDSFGELESVESVVVIAQAQPNLQSNSLVGSWDFNIEENGTYDKTIISFTDTGEFFFFNINSDDDDNCRSRGYEYGSYERDGNSINLTRIIDTNGCVGIFDATENQSEATFTVMDEDRNAVTVSIFDPIDNPQGIDPDILNWTRILTNSDSIVGSWHEVFEGQQGNLSNLLIFLGDGRMYAMDADVNNTDENDFFYGDYSYNGTTFTRTWVFQGFPDDVSAQNNNTQIIDNRLVFSAEDSLARNVPDLQSADAPLAFTESELDTGFTWYFVGPFDDCSSEWLVEEMTFDASVYSLDNCGLGNGQEDNEEYEILASGIVHLVRFGEYIRRLSFDPEIQAYTVCYASTEQDAINCATESQGLAFINRADAQAYVDARLEGFSALSSGTFNSQVAGDDLPTVLVFNTDGTGTWSYGVDEPDSITWSVALDSTLVINFDGGGSEIYTLTSGTIESGSVSIDFSNEPTKSATWERVGQDTDEFVGAWRLDLDPEGSNAYNQVYLTLLETGEFFFIENDTTDPECREAGYEYGTYTIENDRIELDVSFDSNGCIGLIDTGTSETLIIETHDSPNTLIVSVPDEDGEFDMTRMAPPVHSIVGLYHEPFSDSANNQGANDLSQILLFTGANTFFITDYDRTDISVNDFSYGTYQFDGANGELELDFVFATPDAENNSGDSFSITGVVLSEDAWTFDEGSDTTSIPRQGPVQNSSQPNIAVESTWTVTSYQQGEFRSENGAASTMQCDSDGGPAVGDVERYAEWWQLNGSTLTLTSIEFPDDPYTAGFNVSTGEVDLTDMEVEQDPTGEVGDIFTNTFEVSGTLAWNDAEQAFIGSITEVKTLEWSLNSDTSVCTTEFDLRVEYQSGNLSEFLGAP